MARATKEDLMESFHISLKEVAREHGFTLQNISPTSEGKYLIITMESET